MLSRLNWWKRVVKSRRFGSRWLALSILLLLSTTSSGCQLFRPDPPPAESLPDRSSCRDGNAEEWAGFNSIVQVAIDQKKKGDEYHVAQAAEWLGAMLFRCFPDRFATAPPAAPSEPPPPPAPPEPAAPGAPEETPDETP